MPSAPLFSAEQRASRYWFDDGLPTLLTGLACLLMAFFLLYPRTGNSSPVATVVSLAAVVLYGVVLLRQREILDWLKSRITYPRTGYVRPPHFAENANPPQELTILSLGGANAAQAETANALYRDRKRRMGLTMILTMAAVLPMLFFRNPWLCSLAGLLLAAAMWFGARLEQRLSWIVLAGLPVLGVTLSLFLPRDRIGPERAAWFLAGSGVLFVLEGALTLFSYLRQHPRATQSYP
jgi:hypothetical protein